MSACIPHRRGSSFRRLRKRVAAGRRWLGCALALASMWHAPIPWVHAHDLQVPTVEHLAPLQRHVEDFHSGEVEAGETHRGIHAHLVLPWRHSPQTTHGTDGPAGSGSDSEEDESTLLIGAASTSTPIKSVGRPADRAFDSAVANSGASAPHQPVWNGVALFSFSHGRHFFETFGHRVSIGDLCCVRLC